MTTSNRSRRATRSALLAALLLIAGATAVQLGTVNFFDPTAAPRIADALPEVLTQLGVAALREVVGTLQS